MSGVTYIYEQLVLLIAATPARSQCSLPCRACQRINAKKLKEKADQLENSINIPISREDSLLMPGRLPGWHKLRASVSYITVE